MEMVCAIAKGAGGREEDDKYLANYRTGTVPLACLQPHPTTLPRPPCPLLALFVTVCGVGRAGEVGGRGAHVRSIQPFIFGGLGSALSNSHCCCFVL